MRKLVVWIAAIAAVVFVIVSITELENILSAMRKGNWLFLLLAFLLQIICLINNTYTYRSLYHLVGLEESLRNLFMMSTASTFVNMVAPSGGLVGVTVFIDTARRRNLSTARVMVVGILYGIYEYISLLCVVVLGFVALIRRHNLAAGEIVAAVWLLLLTVLLVMILYIGYHSAKRLGELMSRVANWINRLLYRFFHRNVINPEDAHNLAIEIGEGVAALRETKHILHWPLFFAMCNKVLLIGLLTSILLSLRVPFSLGTVVAGYGLAQLFFYVTPTPAGIGFVEGIFPVILNALLIPFPTAVLVTLIYRGITVWLSFGLGFVTFRRLQKTELKPENTPPLL